MIDAAMSHLRIIRHGPSTFSTSKLVLGLVFQGLQTKLSHIHTTAEPLKVGRLASGSLINLGKTIFEELKLKNHHNMPRFMLKLAPGAYVHWRKSAQVIYSWGGWGGGLPYFSAD